MSKDRTGRFFAFLLERHTIYLRRSAGESRPWTTDPILQQYRFCNVYRELDRVTVWIRQHIREPYAEHPNLWFMLAIARQINWPPTLAELMARKVWPVRRWHGDAACEVLRARQGRGEQVYTGAYMLTGGSWGGAGRDKPSITCLQILEPLWRQRREVAPRPGDTLETAWRRLLRCYGFGPFMAYEVVTDWRWTRYLRGAPDVLTWANPGPGARRGLNRLHGRPVNERSASQAQMIAEMQALFARASEYWPAPSVEWPALELREIEHGLCEWDKYERVRCGEGRPRSRYAGRPEEQRHVVV